MTGLLSIATELGTLSTHGQSLDVDLTTGLGGTGIGAFLTTLLVGAILIAIAPEYTNRMTRRIQEEFVQSLLYGILILVGLVVLILLLVLTIVGILVVLPLILIAIIVWAVGSAIAFLTIGYHLVDTEDWKLPLLVGAAINGGLALTGIGGLISFVIAASGFGAVVSDWLGSSQ